MDHHLVKLWQVTKRQAGILPAGQTWPTTPLRTRLSQRNIWHRKVRSKRGKCQELRAISGLHLEARNLLWEIRIKNWFLRLRAQNLQEGIHLRTKESWVRDHQWGNTKWKQTKTMVAQMKLSRTTTLTNQTQRVKGKLQAKYLRQSETASMVKPKWTSWTS